MPIAHDITPEEMDLCLAAITRHPKGAYEIRYPPSEAYSLTTPAGRSIYVNFVRPQDLPLEAIYRTWIVQIGGGAVKRVLYIQSRRGAGGDDTLPDDD